MSCNCSKCNNKPCGCEDSALNTPCSYTECSQGTPCSEVICDECVIHCGETYTFCYGEVELENLQQQLDAINKQIASIDEQIAVAQTELLELQEAYDKLCKSGGAFPSGKPSSGSNEA